MRQYVFHNMEVSKATYSACSPHSANACCMRGLYRDSTSILSLSSHRRNRRPVLCAYCPRPTTKGAQAVKLIHPEWMRPTIIHARVWRWRRSNHLGCWLRTETSVSYRCGVFSMAISLARVFLKEES